MEDVFSRIVADKWAFFKHQKMEDDDLTDDQKADILRTLAAEKLAVFLTRYQKYLNPSDCDHFNESSDFVVQAIVKQIRGKHDITEKEKRNWRFNAMQKLLQEGVFFSDSKMREREPYLFDAMIGRFLSEEERTEHLRPTVFRETSECTWSTLLNRFEDSTEIAERRNLQEMEWEGARCNDGGQDHISRFMAHVQNQTDDFVPEEEDDEETGAQRVEEEGEDSKEKTVKKEEEEDDIEKLRKELERLAKIEAEQYDELTDEDTPQLLRQEFEAFMQQKFLAGKDTEFFDYSTCEDNGATDPIRERDDEERWFDEDD